MVASLLNLPPTARNPDTEVPVLEGRGKSPPSSVTPVLLAKARGALQGIFHLATSRLLGLRDTGSLKGSKVQKDFFTEGFLWSTSQIFYFPIVIQKQGKPGVSGVAGGTEAGWEYSSNWYHQQGLNPKPLVPSLPPELGQQHLIW